MLSKYHATIYHFISTRSRSSNAPTSVDRPDINRRLNYSGSDAGDVLKETQTLYGTLPKTIDFDVVGNQIRLNRDGLMVVRSVNLLTVGIIAEITDTVINGQQQMLQTSEKIQTSRVTIGTGSHVLSVPALVAGTISFSNTKFDSVKAKSLFGEHETEEEEVEEERLERPNFSFIDTSVVGDTYSATAVGEFKGTVFGLSGDSDRIVLVPQASDHS